MVKDIFVNTTSGAVTMTMPSGSAGAIVSIQDYNKTFDTNALTITPASGEKINGGTADSIFSYYRRTRFNFCLC